LQAAINEHADLSIFKEKLSAAVIAGLILITISYLIGIPAVFIIGGIAAWLKTNVGGYRNSFDLRFSWLLLMLGLYLAGPKYGKALGHWAVRVTLEKILGDEANTIRSLPQEGSENDTTKN